MFQPAPLAIMQECDGVRILSQSFNDLIDMVDTPVMEIHRIASMSPDSILLIWQSRLSQLSVCQEIEIVLAAIIEAERESKRR